MASIYERSRDKARKNASWYIGYVDETGKQRTAKGPQHDLEDGQGQGGACQAVSRAGEQAVSKPCDMLQGGVAVQDLEDEPVDDSDGVEAAPPAAVPDLSAGGADRIGS